MPKILLAVASAAALFALAACDGGGALACGNAVQAGGPVLVTTNGFNLAARYSPEALELCGAECDVYLMWPEPKQKWMRLGWKLIA